MKVKKTTRIRVMKIWRGSLNMGTGRTRRRRTVEHAEDGDGETVPEDAEEALSPRTEEEEVLISLLPCILLLSW